MEFGTLIFTKPERAISDSKLAEQLGFTHAWIPDSHMIWGDAYACMALAAVNTRTIKLGTGVAIASNRIPPVTVHSIATINQIAPGRVILGFGTGHTGRRVMGLPPVRFADFREQVRVIHDLLKTGEAAYNAEGQSRRIRFLNRDRRFINLDDPIPFYVAGNGPRTLGLAGEFGDGILTTGVTKPERMAIVRRQVEDGARRAGRPSGGLPCVSLTHVCVLRPGEKLDSPRVAQMTGHWVMTSFHAIAAGYARPHGLPPMVRKAYDAYAEYVSTLGPPDERHLALHEGHCAFVAPAERRFVTPETIKATTIVGTRDEVRDQIKALEEAGLSQIFINPPMDGFEESVKEISRELIERG
jgi:alkanesulfonate monooxygenase SsuD/methylene tetrahydromethanopterin reductase-like flavin-dependent oxidoreductase (luciferase family)